jgi:hypothetical protein
VLFTAAFATGHDPVLSLASIDFLKLSALATQKNTCPEACGILSPSQAAISTKQGNKFEKYCKK